MICYEEYGKALYMLADEENITDTVLEQLSLIKRILSDNPEYIKLLDTPAVPNDKRIDLIDRAFGDSETILLNFIKILCAKRSIYQFGKCVSEYTKIYDKENNIIRAIARTAVPMTDMQLSMLKDKLEHITKKTVVLENRVDDSVIGGVAVSMPDIQLDGSIKSKLKSLRESLCNVIV